MNDRDDRSMLNFYARSAQAMPEHKRMTIRSNTPMTVNVQYDQPGGAFSEVDATQFRYIGTNLVPTTRQAQRETMCNTKRRAHCIASSSA
jgi:hypothetical protein